jgi:hypothetical protein
MARRLERGQISESGRMLFENHSGGLRFETTEHEGSVRNEITLPIG